MRKSIFRRTMSCALAMALALNLSLPSYAAETKENSSAAAEETTEQEELQEADEASGESTEESSAAEESGTDASESPSESESKEEEADGPAASVDGKEYTDFREALAQWCSNGGTLKLLADGTNSVENTERIEVTYPGMSILDLNGYTFTVNGIIIVNGSLTVTDTSEEKNGQLYESKNYKWDKSSLVSMNGTGVTFRMEHGTIDASVMGFTGNAFSMGNYTVTESTNVFQMVGGTIVGGASLYGCKEVSITTGKILSTYGGSSSFSVDNSTAEIEIGSDEAEEPVEITGISKRGAARLKIKNAVITQLSGELSADDDLSGARILSDFSEAIPDGYTCIKHTDDQGDYYTMELLTEENAEASIDGKLYGSLKLACQAAKAGETVTVFVDYNETEQLWVSAGVTVDLNGHDIINTNNEEYWFSSTAIRMGIDRIESDYIQEEPVRMINSAEKTSTVKGRIPLMFSAMSSYMEGSVEENIQLIPNNPDDPEVVLNGGAYLLDTQENRNRIKITNFLSAEKDGKRYLFDDGAFGHAGTFADNKTVVLQSDYDTASSLSYSCSGEATIDLNGHTYKYTGDYAGISMTAPNANLTIKNGKVEISDGYGIKIGNGSWYNATNSTLTLDNVEVVTTAEGKAGLFVEDTSENVTVILKNGTTVTSTNGPGIYFPGTGSLTIEDSTVISKKDGVQIGVKENNTNSYYSTALYAEEGDGSAEPIQVTLDGAKITSDSGNAMTICAPEAEKQPVVTITGASEMKGADCGISLTSNGEIKNAAKLTVESGTVEGSRFGITGDSSCEGTEIKINGGEIKAEAGAGIYHPQDGSLTLNGGSITGATGVQICGGSLSVPADSTVQVKATGTDQSSEETGEGLISDGAAISIVKRNGSADLGTIEIKGGSYTSSGENTTAVKAYEYDEDSDTKVKEFDNTADTVQISGGSFSAKPEDSLVADTSETEVTDGGQYRVTLKTGFGYVEDYKQEAGEDLEPEQYQVPGAEAFGRTEEEAKALFFAGWYTDETCTEPYTATSGAAYAKFVSNQMISIKAQISADAAESDQTNMRLITAVDTLDYQKVGIRVQYEYNGKQFDQKKETKNVYETVNAVHNGQTVSLTGPAIFGTDEAMYIMTRRIDNIPKDAYDTAFTVNAYWVTLDGTTVSGTQTTKSVAQGIGK